MPRETTELPRLASRPADSNKGTFGRILVVAGSRGMSGAAVLCGGAALRGGAGLVRVAVPEEIQPLVAVGHPCYMTVRLPQDDSGTISASAQSAIMDLAKQNDIVALGPGLGRSAGLGELVTALVHEISVPLVLDADALNAIGTRTHLFRERQAPLILTPHPGEFARLVGSDVPTVQANRLDRALKFAADHRVVLVLKGNRTIVADAERWYVNTTGNPGMATGGTGDVLTGLIAAFLGQKLEPFAAAQLGVHLHGLAGDLARDAVGEVSLLATDLLDHLPRALRTRQ